MILVKIGGAVATDERKLNLLLADFAASSQYQFVLVHGGGKEVTQLGEKLGLQAQFRDGVRMTSSAEMDVVDMVLGGKINIALVRRARAAGLEAVGLGGQDAGLFTGTPRTYEGIQESRTGQITEARPRLLNHLLAGGFFPIVNSTSTDANGRGLNINADEAAQELAQAARAELLVYISDIDGVLKDGQVLSPLNEHTVEVEIASGVISGGMIPKVRNALEALRSGVGRVVIGGYRTSGDLQRLLTEQSGTTLVL